MQYAEPIYVPVFTSISTTTVRIPIYKHPDLNPSRIKKDEAAVLKILETISTTFIDPLNPQPLLSISNGVLATDKVSSDMLSAKAFGKAAMDELIRDRLSKKKIHCFF